jgi:hypothetical protein
MTNFWSQVIFVILDYGKQKGLGASDLWGCYAQCAHAIAKNLYRLGQVLGSYRASKSKKSNFLLSSKMQKNRFSEDAKVV